MATKRTDGRYTIKKTFNGKPKYFYGKTKKEVEEGAVLQFAFEPKLYPLVRTAW